MHSKKSIIAFDYLIELAILNKFISIGELRMRMSINEQIKIITKGVDNLVSEEVLRRKLENSKRENRPLIIKLGLDPSAPDIHLGHAVVLRKIKQM